MEEEPSTSSGIKRSIPQELQDAIEYISKHPRTTAKPEDLDENQKRWLVVGICLHSVISPVMRKYIVPTLTKLCYTLSIKYKLETQTFPTHLQNHPLTNRTFLNYEAVNNNKVNHGYHKAKYDYKIKSVVDLSKLFLQTHMIHYTCFDDKCDSSALLGLIINIDQFDPVVKSVAEDVRRYVRNPWAHCDFTEWDAVNYSSSFQLMKKLVTDLKLNLNEKTQIIGEIEKWEMNGPRFLSGTTYGLELVNEFRQQTRALAEYSQLVATETDSNFIRMENELKNDEILLLYKLDLLKKDIDKRLFEIDKVLVDQDKTLKNHNTQLEILRENIIQCACHDSHFVEMEFWKKQELMFVETPPVIKVLQCLQSEHTVLIVGEPGIGKSMLMHHVALKIHSTTSYCIVPCSGIQDIFNHYNIDKRQMFVIDDICGRFTPSLSDIECLIKNKDKLKRMLGEGKTKIAATCRLDIYLEETFCVSCTVFQPNIFNLSEEYSKEDKLKICMKYLSKTSCELLKDQNVEFTPLMCYLYSKNEEFNLTDFLHFPYDAYQKEWEMLKAKHPHKYCSLFLFVIHNGIIKESFFDIFNKRNNKQKDVLKNIYEICELNRCTSRIKMKSTFDSMIGTYLVKTKTEYRVIHDKMFDFLCSYFGSKDTLVRCILRYSDIRVFNERTQLESINEKHDKFSILISKRYEQEYFARIKNDLQLGKINQCFCNAQMKHEKHRAKFLKVLQTIDGNFLFEQMFSKKCLQYTFKDKTYVEIKPSIEYNEDSSYSDDDCDLFEPLISSCSRGYYDIVQFFITKYVNLKNYYSFYTPLTAACSGGHEKIVLLLLEKGFDIDKNDDASQTPLTAACSGGHFKIVQLLTEKGCELSHDRQMGNTPLTAACLNGNENILQLLIERGCDINQADEADDTPLTAACSRGHFNIVQLLIEKGCELSYNSCLGNTPLTAACTNGNEKIVQLLTRKGCDINQVDGWNEIPLTAACIGGHEQIVQLLIDKGCDVIQADGVEKSPMTAACWGGNERIVQLLIENGCNINGQGNNITETPLLVACWNGNYKIVQLLIDKACDVTQANGRKETPLTAACLGGNEKVVQLLIENGCDINDQVYNIRNTPLAAACTGENEEVVQLLIENECDFDDQDDNTRNTPLAAACTGENEKVVQLLIENECDINDEVIYMRNTPLAAACTRENEEVVQLLIENECDIDDQDDNTINTPLAAACTGGNEKVVQLLIDNGCDINQFDDMENTPLAAAFAIGNEKFVQFLIDKGCDVTQADCRRKIYLVAACRGGNMQIVQLLLEKGCDVNQVNDMGQTPLTAACSNKNESIVQFLINAGCDINQVDGLSGTPLEAACKSMGGNEKIVQLLLDQGCDVEEKHLKAAYDGENDKIIQLIKEKRCEFDHFDGIAKTPLTAAYQLGNEKKLQLRQDKGSDVNQAGEEDESFLEIRSLQIKEDPYMFSMNT